ncbi:MAG: hypothetical protein JW943_09215 [Deltaproteobacteria bacterium]|nr:hypothetical protein [Deltaproteobacteria bacterium]
MIIRLNVFIKYGEILFHLSACRPLREWPEYIAALITWMVLVIIFLLAVAVESAR